MSQAIARELETIETNDLYYAAYMLSQGGKLEAAEVVPRQKRQVLFAFTGAQICRRAHEYLSGEAVVNVRGFKSALDHLKGIIFEKLHE